MITNAQREATNRYKRSKAQITITIDKEMKQAIQTAAVERGLSVTQYLCELVKRDLNIG